MLALELHSLCRKVGRHTVPQMSSDVVVCIQDGTSCVRTPAIKLNGCFPRISMTQKVYSASPRLSNDGVACGRQLQPRLSGHRWYVNVETPADESSAEPRDHGTNHIHASHSSLRLTNAMKLSPTSETHNSRYTFLYCLRTCESAFLLIALVARIQC